VKPLALAAVVAAFVLAATANSGGYRYGVSDQAFYATAVVKDLHPSRFPRDSRLLDVEAGLMWADEIVAGVVRAAGGRQPPVYLVLYIASLVLLCAAAVAFGRSAGFSWWAIAGLLVLLTFRHRISKTGANSLEGYMHPRMIAFAFGVVALAAVMRARHLQALCWTVLVACWHPTTALWFGTVVGVATIIGQPDWRRWTLGALAVAAGVGIWMVWLGPLAGRLTIMDAAWLRVLAEKDYLFPHEWPAYAWATNLLYPILVVAIYRQRRAQGRLAAGEAGLVAGLVALALVFLISFPLTVMRVALAVQLQVTRVFWVLDFAMAAYLAWWIFDGWLPARRVARTAAIALLITASVGRGVFLLSQDRRLFSPGLSTTPWVDAMNWLRARPEPWHVLVDPGHAWKYGVSARLAAEKDILVEAGKDSALALYDREIAMAVGARLAALDDFEHITPARLAALAQSYGLDVAVLDGSRRLDLPELYRNTQFVIYQIR
jgi:hypothetical protein